MIACEKQFSVEITTPAPNGPDWSQLLWGAAAIYVESGTTATFTPSSAVGATFSANLTCPTSTKYCSTYCVAQLLYTGSNATCQLHAICSSVAADLNTQGGNAIIEADGDTVGFFTFINGGYINGTFDLSFNIPGGTNVLIEVFVDTASFADSGVYSLVGTFSNT